MCIISVFDTSLGKCIFVGTQCRELIIKNMCVANNKEIFNRIRRIESLIIQKNYNPFYARFRKIRKKLKSRATHLRDFK